MKKAYVFGPASPKRVLASLGGLFALILILPLPILAKTMQNNQLVIVASDQVIDHNYYNAGNTVNIYGTINGDVFVAGNTITIDSQNINGDIFAAGNTITIKGTVNGSLRLAGQNIFIDGQISGNVLAGGQNINLNSSSVVNGHVTVAGQSIDSQGVIKGQLEAAGEMAYLNGQVDKDVYLQLGQTKLQVGDQAKIGGKLFYKSLEQGQVSDKAQISQGVFFEPHVPKQKPSFKGFGFGSFVVKFFGMLVVGMILMHIWPKFLPESVETIKKNKAGVFFKGFGWLILTPILLIIVAITIIGLPLAGLLFILWMLGLYLAKIIAAWLLIALIRAKFFKDKKLSNIWWLAIGILLYIILGKIPFIGWVIAFVLYVFAWGALANILPKLKKS